MTLVTLQVHFAFLTLTDTSLDNVTDSLPSLASVAVTVTVAVPSFAAVIKPVSSSTAAPVVPASFTLKLYATLDLSGFSCALQLSALKVTLGSSVTYPVSSSSPITMDESNAEISAIAQVHLYLNASYASFKLAIFSSISAAAAGESGVTPCSAFTASSAALYSVQVAGMHSLSTAFPYFLSASPIASSYVKSPSYAAFKFAIACSTMAFFASSSERTFSASVRAA